MWRHRGLPEVDFVTGSGILPVVKAPNPCLTDPPKYARNRLDLRYILF